MNYKSLAKLHTPNIDVLQHHMWRHTLSLLILLLATLLFPWNFGTQVKSIYYSLLHLTTACKRPLLSPTNLRHGPTENTSRGLYPQLCDVTAYAEVCLPSHCLETGYITPLFCCCMHEMQSVYRAVAWRCVNMSQYYIDCQIVWHQDEF
jgi:hypothetical protein